MKELKDLSLADLNQLFAYHLSIMNLATGKDRVAVKANMRAISAELHERISNVKGLQQIELSI